MPLKDHPLHEKRGERRTTNARDANVTCGCLVLFVLITLWLANYGNGLVDSYTQLVRLWA